MNPACKLVCLRRPPPLADTIRNWPAWNKAVKRRGPLTIWFDPAMTREPAPTGKRDRQPARRDAAMQACLTMKVLFAMALCQATGFGESLLRLVGPHWSVPDFSTFSRRRRRPRGCCDHTTPPERQSHQARHRRSGRTHQDPADVQARRARDLATIARLSGWWKAIAANTARSCSDNRHALAVMPHPGLGACGICGVDPRKGVFHTAGCGHPCQCDCIGSLSCADGAWRIVALRAGSVGWPGPNRQVGWRRLGPGR